MRLGLGPVLAVAGGSLTESQLVRAGCGMKNCRCREEQDKEIGLAQTSTVHHDSVA
jgi:hypothetical protein